MADTVQEVLARLTFRRDVRRSPDRRRLGQFRTGWRDAVHRGDAYAEETLEDLTWRNLGYRMAKHFGDQTPGRIDEVFESLAALYDQQPPKDPAVDAQPPTSATRSANASTSARLKLAPGVREIVASAAAFIQRRRPEYYFASTKGRKLWLHCGRIIPLSVTPTRVWLSVIEASLAPLSKLRSWSWDDHSSYQRYVRTSSRNGYYDATLDESGSEWKLIAPAFFDYLDVLCAEGHQADHRTKSTPGLREEIATWGSLRTESAAFDHAVRIASRSEPDARRTRLSTAPRQPPMIQTVVQVFQRNPDVVAEVVARANGRCELCAGLAPFVRASDGSPYLEVHHRVRLADGGDDTVANAVAACPNCHRKEHFG